MSLNPKYVTAPSLQEYFVDKATGLPLVGGKVYFYRDSNRTDYKSVYELQGNSANYTYVALSNPVTLSAVGTIQDNSKNDIIPYYYPLDENGDIDLYYIRVYSSTGVFQFERQAWPNPNVDGGGVGSDELINYIPNGQFLAHTDLPDNELVAGSNVLAQGGFTFELPDPLPGPTPSVNTAEFIVENFTDIPSQSPRYVLQVQCTTFNALDSIKALRIKFKDVNKFSSKPSVYTFAFAANAVGQNIPAVISTYKFFGTDGSPAIKTPKENFTITPAGSTALYQFTIDFGLNTGENVDTVNNDDFVAIDIDLPVGTSFTAQFVDFVLSPGEVQVLNFPVQTDADMLTRGVMGWVETPDGQGMDLYLPPILTKEGMIWDNSQIGDIGMSIFPIDDPNADPAPQHNKMPCDGAIYLSDDFSSNGIPYRRLLNKLLTINVGTTEVNGVPMFGTGMNYVTAAIPFNNVDPAVTNEFRITYNLAGTGSALAAEGGLGFETGFTFSPMYTYSGSGTGIASTDLTASTTGVPSVVFVFSNGDALAIADNNTGFTFTQVNGAGDLMAFQKTAWTIGCLSGAALIIGGAGRYFLFTVGSALYYMWFNVDGANTDPAVGGRIGIEVNINTVYSDTNVADCVREALMGFASTKIVVEDIPPAGSYFTFSSNPGALRNFYAWYSVNGVGIDPNIPGAIGIHIVLSGALTEEVVRDATRFVINAYQFQAPFFDGMFPRFADPDSVWDFDAVNRWSNTIGFGGPNPGTFEFSQFLSHNHLLPGNVLISGVPNLNPAGTSGGPNSNNVLTNVSGGSETRPVNTYLYPYVRY